MTFCLLTPLRLGSNSCGKNQTRILNGYQVQLPHADWALPPSNPEATNRQNTTSRWRREGVTQSRDLALSRHKVDMSSSLATA